MIKRTRRRRSERPREDNGFSAIQMQFFDLFRVRIRGVTVHRMENILYKAVQEFWKNGRLPHYTHGQWCCGFDVIVTGPLLQNVSMTAMFVGPKKPSRYKLKFSRIRHMKDGRLV